MARAQVGPAAEVASYRDTEVADSPGWLAWSTFLLSLVGLGISIYLTIEHYTGNKQLLCSATSTVNCLKVTTSPESVIFGVPVAVYGLAFFVVLVGLTSPWVWRITAPLVHLARLVALVVGIGMVLYLVYVELFQVKAICLWCTGVHVITFLLLMLVLTFGPTVSAMLGHERD